MSQNAGDYTNPFVNNGVLTTSNGTSSSWIGGNPSLQQAYPAWNYSNWSSQQVLDPEQGKSPLYLECTCCGKPTDSFKGISTLYGPEKENVTKTVASYIPVCSEECWEFYKLKKA